MKLTKAQQRVLDKMRHGWQLGHDMTLNGRYWLQQGGCGRGGEFQTVPYPTVHALEQKGAIEIDLETYPRRTYRVIPTEEP